MKILKKTLLVLYILLLIIATISLFTFNEFSNSTFSNKTIIGLNKKLDTFNKGSLLIVKKQNQIEKDDKIIYYNTVKGKNIVAVAQVKKIMRPNKKEKTYVIKDNLFLSSQYLIGKTKDIKEIPLLGYIYNLITNRIIYLILFVIPMIIYFYYELRKYQKQNNEKS